MVADSMEPASSGCRSRNSLERNPPWITAWIRRTPNSVGSFCAAMRGSRSNSAVTAILVAVLVTGMILAVRASPLTPLHIVKIAASLVAVGCALMCVRWVFQRQRIEDVNVLLAYRRRIWTLAAVATVFAIPALYLGLMYFRQ